MVFASVACNWLELTIHYVVEAKKWRMQACSLYKEVFKRVQRNKQIQIASETMDIAVHRDKAAWKQTLQATLVRSSRPRVPAGPRPGR